MSTLKIKNGYSWLITDNTDVKLKLWRVLRFRDKGYFHNAAYKMRLWDGYVDFFDRESGRFLTGLLHEIKMALKHYNVNYVEEDLREPFNFTIQEADKSFLPNVKELRDYQVEYINQAIKHQRGIIFAPTSAGKSNIMVGILKALGKTPTLVLCPTKDLVEQNYDEIRKNGIMNVGRINSDHNDPNLITCMTYQSWHKYKKYSKSVKALIVDEIHDMMSKGPKAIYRQLDNCSVRIAMSATPFKFGGTDSKQKYEVKGHIGPVFFVKSMKGGKPTTKGLQERNILSSADLTFYEYNTDNKMPPYLLYVDVVTHGIAENLEFHNLVARRAMTLNGRTLIMVDRIRQGDLLHERIPGAVWVRGQDTTKTRKEVIQTLKTGQGNIVAIATAKIFNTGVNVFLHNLINAAGGKADHTIIQRLGRGLRTADDKTNLQYYDFYFKHNEYLEKHSEMRVKILEKEGHKVVIKKELDF